MSSITAATMADLGNQNAAARVAAVTVAEYSLGCWLDIAIATKPVTMGFHRSRRPRRSSP